MSKLAEIHSIKDRLRAQERELIDLTMDERDSSESHDVHMLEKARMAVSESLVQIDLFLESRTASKWRQQ